MLAVSVKCCPVGTETNDAVHEGGCTTVDPQPPAWALLVRDHIDSEPNPSTGRVIRWFPGPFMTRVVGHLWRDDRGPYAMCHRADCQLWYSRWSGDVCRGRAEWPPA